MGFMNEMGSLDDALLFASVARLGSLSAVAKVHGIPLPTLSRRMARFERAMGFALFLRGPSGYALTAEGRAFAEDMAGVEALSAKLARWQTRGEAAPEVRITAGDWTARALALAFAEAPPSGFRARFMPTSARLDLARREADIGIRNQVPDHNWLAGQKLAPVRFAIFGLAEADGFVLGPETLPSQRWVQSHHGDAISAQVADMRLALDLAVAGHGRVVLPVFVGAQSPLDQLGDVISELTHDAWLVVHQDARHDPPIRAAMEAVIGVLGV